MANERKKSKFGIFHLLSTTTTTVLLPVFFSSNLHFLAFGIQEDTSPSAVFLFTWSEGSKTNERDQRSLFPLLLRRWHLICILNILSVTSSESYLYVHSPFFFHWNKSSTKKTRTRDKKWYQERIYWLSLSYCLSPSYGVNEVFIQQSLLINPFPPKQLPFKSYLSLEKKSCEERKRNFSLQREVNQQRQQWRQENLLGISFLPHLLSF